MFTQDHQQNHAGQYIRSEKIREMESLPPAQHIDRQRIKWLGHMKRVNAMSDIHEKSWIKCVKDSLRSNNIPLDRAYDSQLIKRFNSPQYPSTNGLIK